MHTYILHGSCFSQLCKPMFGGPKQTRSISEDGENPLPRKSPCIRAHSHLAAGRNFFRSSANHHSFDYFFFFSLLKTRIVSPSSFLCKASENFLVASILFTYSDFIFIFIRASDN